MSEELNKEPNGAAENKGAAENIETAPGETENPAEPQAAPARRNDPWKTAFIVLAGISVISAGIFYTIYAKKNDLPTTSAPSVDANAQPVQMANPPTGMSEQAALSQPLPQVTGNAADLGAVPGGYDPWANPGRFQNGTQPGSGPYQVYPTSPPGQTMYMEVNPNSPFMQDGNTYVMVPANTAVNANRAAPPNANKAVPAASPSPGTTSPAGNTAPPTMLPKPDVKANTAPAANKPAPKPPVKKPSTGKPSGT